MSTRRLFLQRFLMGSGLTVGLLHHDALAIVAEAVGATTQTTPPHGLTKRANVSGGEANSPVTSCCSETTRLATYLVKGTDDSEESWCNVTRAP